MPNLDPRPSPTISEEERLRQENLELKRQIERLREPESHGHQGVPSKLWKPSAITISAIVFASILLVVVAFLGGYGPLQKRRAAIVSEAKEREEALPRVDVIQVGLSTNNATLELPGNIQAINEAPILARADGYIGTLSADIGDRVQAGQILARIEAPELDDQARQVRATLAQAQAAVEQSLATYEQGKSEAELARVTAQRWADLATQGIASKQDNDQYQAAYQSRAAAMRALEKGIAVQRANLTAAEANVARLEKVAAYRSVKAPFSGVITLRNLDTGALVSNGSTLLFRIAQTGTLRIYANVPQTHANSVHVGHTARIHVSNLPGREFSGSVARTASSLDPTNRTLLTEIHVPNPQGLLLPGMYATVQLMSPRLNAPLLVPSDALLVRAEGTSVALVRPDHTVHLQKIQVGRDYGDRLEVLGGLQEGDFIIPNPGDTAREGLKVEMVEKPPQEPSRKAAK